MMNGERTIVGIGEALQVRTPGGESAGGLAASIAIRAAGLGYRSIAISRVGQDTAGELLRSSLRRSGAIDDHVQSDPDLATGRLTERTLAGRSPHHLDSRAAFDNLQWDSDLQDVAQQADAVVYGALARRNSQTRNTIDRFLSECRGALCVFDLTNQGNDEADRTMLIRGIGNAQGVIADSTSLRLIAPGSGEEPLDTTASTVRQRHDLAFLMLIDDDGRLRSFAEGDTARSEDVIEWESRDAATVGLLHGLLVGWNWGRSLAAGARYARFAAEHPDETPPPDLFDVT